ncbi:hypothetical protein A9320_27580 [Ruegeria sp. PBVC088]|nr:hypothetical protein A9320_27580 [Ruegeria sp. PBVC088]
MGMTICIDPLSSTIVADIKAMFEIKIFTEWVNSAVLFQHVFQNQRVQFRRVVNTYSVGDVSMVIINLKIVCFPAA